MTQPGPDAQNEATAQDVAFTPAVSAASHPYVEPGATAGATAESVGMPSNADLEHIQTQGLRSTPPPQPDEPRLPSDQSKVNFPHSADN
jgi:hypothetical protein